MEFLWTALQELNYKIPTDCGVMYRLNYSSLRLFLKIFSNPHQACGNQLQVSSCFAESAPLQIFSVFGDKKIRLSVFCLSADYDPSADLAH
jgi:hypothetical protein